MSSSLLAASRSCAASTTPHPGLDEFANAHARTRARNAGADLDDYRRLAVEQVNKAPIPMKRQHL